MEVWGREDGGAGEKEEEEQENCVSTTCMRESWRVTPVTTVGSMELLAVLLPPPITTLPGGEGGVIEEGGWWWGEGYVKEGKEEDSHGEGGVSLSQH